MYNTKAAIALVYSVLIAGAQAAMPFTHNDTALMVITVVLAAAAPVNVWATSNTKKSAQSLPVYTQDLP